MISSVPFPSFVVKRVDQGSGHRRFLSLSIARTMTLLALLRDHEKDLFQFKGEAGVIKKPIVRK